MRAALALVLLTSTVAPVHASDPFEGVIIGPVTRGDAPPASKLRGLSLDLEACAVGACLRASEGDRLVMSGASSIARIRVSGRW